VVALLFSSKDGGEESVPWRWPHGRWWGGGSGTRRSGLVAEAWSQSGKLAACDAKVHGMNLRWDSGGLN
jgi:hypothetical protein